ncbi:MAG: intracellular septation protein [Candidatus Tokpelaia sp. JSC161]|jgi:intracellular septation protein|nr:MAG: intracellular septation protein [Candidatus Tokpelaia sp. JSC161]
MNPFFKSDRQKPKDQIIPFLQIILEIGPLLIFFLVNFRFGRWLLHHVRLFSSFEKPIYPATALFMISIVLAFGISWRITRQLPLIPLISGIFILLFGSLTLWLNNDTFIKMKPTFFHLSLACLLFGGLIFNKKSFILNRLETAIKLDPEGLRKLTKRLAYFFLSLGLLNEIIWRNFNDEFWTTFKVFGTMPLTIVFMLAQAPLIMRHAVDHKKSDFESC